MHDENFQTLAVEGSILLLKPFLYLGFDVVGRWKSPDLFDELKKISPKSANSVRQHHQSRGTEMTSGAGRLLQPGLGKSRRTLRQNLNKFGDYVGK
jgi:hypothetical protein